MNEINADCGIFWRGDQQIGGCFHATVKMQMAVSGKDGGYATMKIARQSAETSQWWLYDGCKMDIFKAKFYRIRDDVMSLICQYEVSGFNPPVFKNGELMKSKLILNF